MFWDNPNDSEQWQRLKNQAFLKMPFTNKTRDEVMPVLGVVMLILLVAFIAASIFSR